MKNEIYTPEKLDKHSVQLIKINKLFHPINGHTNPLWKILSPIFVIAYIKAIAKKDSIQLAAEKYHVSEKKIIKSMAYSQFVFGMTIENFLDYDLYGKSNAYQEECFSWIQNYQMSCVLNEQDKTDLFSDKSKEMTMHRDYCKRDWCVLKDENDIPTCVDFLQKHPKCLLKQINGSGGKGIILVQKENIPDLEEFFKKNINEIGWILDEYIEQDPTMAEIYPDAVNIVRIHSFFGKNGKVRIVYPYLTVGQDKAFVANYCSGAIGANIDPKTGIVFGELYASLPCKDPRRHPNTGYEIIGMQIPRWDEALAMIGEAARQCPQARYLGWDIALSTDKGWMVIETNSCPGMTGWCSAENRGLKKEFMDLQRWVLEGYHDDFLPEGQVEV